MDKEIKAALTEFAATADNLLGNKIVAAYYLGNIPR